MRDKLTQPKSSRVETAVFAMSPVEVRQACRDLGLWVSLGWAGDMAFTKWSEKWGCCLDQVESGR